ncbi:hypothetical protein PCC6912_46210 [Chlorogloeopsis fritschii PCC 6912]|uniref:Uncharacterized protein n=1 Tax=Chlorogloeopsis fritschii PCC 6912 TaxID=211165 RepID=A0A3S0XQY0_CHLFR|nr:hypothetical protein PCC6912_46210 [Chlorogloeopsis fritschii PCC 6912]
MTAKLKLKNKKRSCSAGDMGMRSNLRFNVSKKKIKDKTVITKRPCIWKIRQLRVTKIKYRNGNILYVIPPKNLVITIKNISVAV